MEGGSGVDLAFHMKLDAGPALQRGSVVHAWCEQIEWIEDGVPDDDALHADAALPALVEGAENDPFERIVEIAASEGEDKVRTMRDTHRPETK